MIGAVRPGWFVVRLTDVTVTSADGARVRGEFPDVWVSLAGLSPKAVEVRGGRVELAGSVAELRDALQRPAASSGSGRMLDVALRDVDVVWRTGGQESQEVSVSAGWLERTSGDVALGAARISGHLGPAAGAVEGVELRRRAGAAPLVSAKGAELTLSSTDDGRKALGEMSPAGDPVPPPIPVTRGKVRGARAPAAPPAVASGKGEVARWMQIPDLRGARLVLAQHAQALAKWIPDGAEFAVEKFAVSLARPALRMGPGRASFGHHAGALHAEFRASAQSASSTALVVVATLPIDAGAVSLHLEGGPVPLGALGISVGDDARAPAASIAGGGDLLLSADGAGLTFDGRLQFRNATLADPRVAQLPLTGVDLDVSARGALLGGREVRLERAEVRLGALLLRFSGAATQTASEVTAQVSFDVPPADCEALFRAAPANLLPSLDGARLDGTLAASGRVAFRSTRLDDALIDYHVDDRCRFVQVAEAIAKEHYQAPFRHRIYLPDQSIAEETTGPGTPKWTRYDAMSPYLTVAVLTTEDGAFFRHHGFSHGAIRSSIVANLKAGKFVRGASTISMQTAKNLFLTRQKTLARKLEEMLLTDYLEQVFSKEEILELYFNIIEFGPAVYGIGAASQFYFGRLPEELTLPECMFLASLLPSPIRFGSMRSRGEVSEGWRRHVDTLMGISERVGLITPEELELGKGLPIEFAKPGAKPERRPPVVRPHEQLPGGSDEPPDVP